MENIHFGGALPNLIDHRDYDLFKTFAGILPTPNFPPDFSLDDGEWMPNQNTPEQVFNNPALPYGCTDYTTADVCATMDGILYNPMFTESVTGANAKGGYHVRDSLLSTVSLGTKDKNGNIVKKTGVFTIKKYANLDWFDSLRFAMLIPDRRCAISWGTPWYGDWETDAFNHKVISAPSSYNNSSSWHNSKIAGWNTINGVSYLKVKSWQGNEIGNNGWLYFPRDVVNQVMDIPGACAFTVTNQDGFIVQRIDTTFTEYIISLIRNLFTSSKMPQQSTKPTIDDFCHAIQTYEGYSEGTRSFRNCNPGNLRFANQVGATGKDADGFAVFPDYQTGYNALKNQVTLVTEGKSHVYPHPCTIAQFFQIYSPTYDQNDPTKYAAFVAKQLGVDVSYQLSNLL